MRLLIVTVFAFWSCSICQASNLDQIKQRYLGKEVSVVQPDRIRHARRTFDGNLELEGSLEPTFTGKSATVIDILPSDIPTLVKTILKFDDGNLAVVISHEDSVDEVDDRIHLVHDPGKFKDDRTKEREADLASLREKIFLIVAGTGVSGSVDIPFLTPMTIVSAIDGESAVEGRATTLQLKDRAGKDYTLTLSSTCAFAFTADGLARCGLISHVPLHLTPREIRAIEGHKIFIGMSRRALDLVKGDPETTNFDAISGEQLVYGMGDYVYLKHNIVVNYQFSY